MLASTPHPHLPPPHLPPPTSSFLRQPMASFQNRKRQCADDITQEGSVKRLKSNSTRRRAANFPPQFWDTLSKVWLTPRALRELDRRNDTRPPATEATAPISIIPTNLARFARRGGPDLCQLRGVRLLRRMHS